MSVDDFLGVQSIPRIFLSLKSLLLHIPLLLKDWIEIYLFGFLDFIKNNLSTKIQNNP